MLDEIPENEVVVLAVWFEMYPGDARGKWPPGLLDDERVRHFWDAEKITGRWYAENVSEKPGEVEWDAYFLYRADAGWGAVRPPELVSWGRTIVAARERLREDLFGLLDVP